jgi:hypothetical protein
MTYVLVELLACRIKGSEAARLVEKSKGLLNLKKSETIGESLKIPREN